MVVNKLKQLCWRVCKQHVTCKTICQNL